MKNIITLLSFIFGLQACKTVIEVDIPDAPVSITLNSFFNQDSTFQVRLTESKPIMNDFSLFVPITGASVSLMADGQPIGELVESTREGFYRLDVQPEPGVAYTIAAQKSGIGSVYASDAVPSEVEAALMSVEQKPESQNKFRLKFSLQDLPGDNFYDVRLYRYYDQFEYVSDTDEWVYVGKRISEMHYDKVGAQLEDYSPNLFSDELFQGQLHEVSIDFTRLLMDNPQTGEPIDSSSWVLQVRHVSHDYFRYEISRKLQDLNKDNPFAEPTPVFNNISGGYGIFAGYSSVDMPFEINKEE